MYADCSKVLGMHQAIESATNILLSDISPGPLISLPKGLFSPSVIVINTRTAADDLLEKRATFACRPQSPLANLLGRQDNVGFAFYGNRLKKMRKVLHTSLNARAIPIHWGGLLDAHSLNLVRSLLESPETFYEDIQM